MCYTVGAQVIYSLAYEMVSGHCNVLVHLPHHMRKEHLNSNQYQTLSEQLE